MSLAEVTAACFNNGVPPHQWVSICCLLKDKSSAPSVDFEGDLSNSVLTLFHANPADPSLLAYIKHALKAKLLTLPAFVVAFLQAAKSPNLQETATLDSLCRLIHEERFASGLSSVGSLVRYGESTITTLATVQDALNLLRTAYTLPMSPFHNLTTTASNLLIALLNCVGDMSQVSTAQAMMHFSDVHDMLQSLRLSGDVRTVLDNFALSLSILLGDDAKMAQEAQMMQTLQLALAKGDIIGPNSESDIISCSLMLRHLVSSRVEPFGSGNTRPAVTMLVATYRGTSWSPSGFYTQLFLSAVSCLAQGNSHWKTNLMWKSFIISRLPELLVSFEQIVNSEGDTDWRGATQAAMTALYHRPDLLAQCDAAVPRTSDDMNTDPESLRIIHSKDPAFFPYLLHYYMARAKLLDLNFVLSIDPALTGEFHSQLGLDSMESGLDLSAYIESRLGVDVDSEEALTFLQRASEDYPSHATFAQVVQKRFIALAQGFDAEGLSHLCKIIYLHEIALDVISLHVRISTIIAHTLAFVEDYDCELVADPQTAVSYLGDLVMFLQSTLLRFQLTASTFALGERTLNAQFLLSTSMVYKISELSNDDNVAFHAWSKALFDISSEGIEDNILRSTNPKTLLKLSASLIFHAISACAEGKMEADVLSNGVSYFTGPLLNWTLSGVIKALLTEIMQRDFSAPAYLEVLQILVQSATCPDPVLCMTAHGILRLMSDPRVQQLGREIAFNPAAMRALANRALGVVAEESPDASPQPLALNAQAPWLEQPRRCIQDALSAARAGKAPALDLSRCVTIAGPVRFLQLLWDELSAAAPLDMETSRRLATFALTCPPNLAGHIPPLLPIFLHIVMPALLLTLGPVNVDLLVAVISTSLTGVMQMEWAIRAVDGEPRHPTGQPSSATARRLAMDLRRSKSPTAAIVLQRLSSSQSFVANFPMMAAGS